MPDQHTLHPLVQSLAQGIGDSPQGLVVAEEVFVASRKQFETVPIPNRPAVRVDLIALAIKAQKLVGDRAAPLISQIYLLLTGLVSSEREARELLEKGGIDLKAAAAALGRVESSTPVATSSVTEGKSLLALRLGMHKK